MYKYLIYDFADEEIYKKQVEAIKKKFQTSDVKESVIDIDGSQRTIIYISEDDNVTIICDYYTNYVGIESTLDLDNYF